MKLIHVFLLISLSLAAPLAQAQERIRSYSFKQGEVLDILLFNTKPGTDSLFQQYLKTVFPHAIEKSYQNLPGFKIQSTAFGNIQPSTMVLGKWDNTELREAFIQSIDQKVPDFHAQRKAIWSTFYLTYYTMKDDVEFSIDKSKFHVATAYWSPNGRKVRQYATSQIQDMQDFGGNMVLSLQDGVSPFGYLYKPDVFVITQWEDEAAFKAYQQAHPGFDATVLTNAQQFIF